MATADLRPAALIPTYDNAGTLGGIVARTLEQIDDVLVVNDGSTDGTAEVLASFGGAIDVVEHDRNRGKGVALRDGLRRLAERGFSHAISLDSDDQHFPEEIPRFLDAIARDPAALVVGERDMRGSGAPLASRFGLWWSNLSLRILGGVRLADSQTGFRAYPIAAIDALDLEGTRFDFEMEVLVKAAWAGIPIVPIPISVSYTPEGGRVSHFRPVRDFLHIARLNIRLLVARPRRAGR